MTQGQYLYFVGKELIGKELRIERKVLLAWDPKADHYEIGESKNPKSRTSTGFVSRGIGIMYAETPVEAVNLYVSISRKHNMAEIEKLKRRIDELERENAQLLKIDHTKLKIHSYPDDWEPCDW